MDKQLTEDEVRAHLFARCLASTNKVAARELGYSAQYIGDVIKSSRPITAALADAMGYERRVVFVEKRITCADILQEAPDAPKP